MNKQIILAVIGVAVLLLVIGAVSSPNRNSNKGANGNGSSSGLNATGSNQSTSTSTLGLFARCLASKNLTMYGAEWCPHCKKEKNRFGSAFKYVPYVECPDNVQLCLAKGVNGYPTWIDAGGTLYEGEQGLEGLAKISGCELPVTI
ncbi:MAG: hypothetical protein KBB54_02665 [Candidatus Pacebacteria bacterium]|nr:hypothetical protein [Candidatus Paceibacterota bacterium]